MDPNLIYGGSANDFDESPPKRIKYQDDPGYPPGHVQVRMEAEDNIEFEMNSERHKDRNDPIQENPLVAVAPGQKRRIVVGRKVIWVTPRPFVCPWCDDRFVSQLALKHHHKNSIGLSCTQEKPLPKKVICQYCLKRFKTAVNIDQHLVYCKVKAYLDQEAKGVPNNDDGGGQSGGRGGVQVPQEPQPGPPPQKIYRRNNHYIQTQRKPRPKLAFTCPYDDCWVSSESYEYMLNHLRTAHV